MLAEKDRALGTGDAAPGEIDGDVLLVAGVELQSTPVWQKCAWTEPVE